LLRRLAPLLLLTTTLAGCDLAPRYARPGLAAPASFPQGPAYASADTGTPDVTTIGWRDFFTDDRLRQTIAIGLANNRDLRIAAANILQARAQYRAQRADLFPTIGASADASIRHTGSNGASVSSGSTNTSGGSGTGSGTGTGNTGSSTFSSAGTSHDYSVELGLSSFELDLFGKIRNATKAAQDAYFATQAGADATRISLISEIATAWLTMGSDQDQLQISKQTLSAFQQSVDITKAQFDKGIVSELDVQQAETNLQNARFDVAQLTTQIAQDQNALNLLVGTTVPAELLPPGIGADDHTLAALPSGLDSTVLLKRPDVVQAEDQLRAQYANIGAARAAFFPTISLTAAAGTASSALTGLFSGGSFSWNATGSSALTLFDFGRNKANLRYAEASRDAAVATYEKAVQTAFREVSDALATRGTIGEQLAARTAGTSAADRAAILSAARYRNGIDSFLTTLDAQRTLYAAQQSLVTTRLQRETNLVTLYQTLGGGLS
jgi:multidrug efflux system outer membrane protein